MPPLPIAIVSKGCYEAYKGGMKSENKYIYDSDEDRSGVYIILFGSRDLKAGKSHSRLNICLIIDDLGESLEDSRYHMRASRQQRLLLATTAAPARSYYHRSRISQNARVPYGSNNLPPSHHIKPFGGTLPSNGGTAVQVQ